MIARRITEQCRELTALGHLRMAAKSVSVIHTTERAQRAHFFANQQDLRNLLEIGGWGVSPTGKFEWFLWAVCAILSLGLWSSMSAPGSGWAGPACPWVGA